MKKTFVAILAVLTIASCNHDDTPAETTGSLSFIVSGSGLGLTNLAPDKLVISVEDANGKTIFDNKVLTLTEGDAGYSTEPLPFDNGNYQITKYLVVSGTTAAFASPRSGSQKASLVDLPLPFDFTVVAGRANTVIPKIVGISSQDLPPSFGYGDFGYNTPGGETQEWINVRVKLELTVGGVSYPNIDAIYTVHGFDEGNNEVWTQDYNYIGPEENDLRIKVGFHHYIIGTEKWGKTLTQNYTAASLYERRVKEGEVPITQVFQADVQPKRVASTVTSFTHVQNGQWFTDLTNKTEYQYVDGRIDVIMTSVWSNEEQHFIEQNKSEFTYSGNLVKKIVTYDVNIPSGFVEDNYTYDDDGNVTHIQHKPSGNGIASDVDLTYSDSERAVRAVYKFSNGAGFEYEVANQHGSTRSDRTTRSGELCSTGNYTYDKNINPLGLLGYVDYLFRNYSISNRLTEDVDYVGCAFPSLVPESYSYVYDADGYPLKQETRYRSTEMKMTVEYNYQ
jgi:hypothetical protein